METARAERRLAAILAADIVGYSRLIEADEAGHAGRDPRSAPRGDRSAAGRAPRPDRQADGRRRDRRVRLGRRRRCVRGRDAEGRRRAAGRGSAPERRIVFRIGINLGDVVVEGDDLLGDGVNVAARLEQLCEPGGCLISGTAYDHLQGKLDVPLEFAGEQHLKNIDRPVRTYRVRLDGVQRRSPPPRRATRRVDVARRGRRPAGARPRRRRVLVALAGRAGAHGTAIDRGAAVRQPGRRRGDRAAGGRDHRGHHHRPVPVPRVRRDRPQLDRGLQGQAGRRAPGRQGAERPLRAGGLDPAAGRSDPGHRAAHRRGDRAHLWSERWDRPAEDVFAVQTEIAEQVASRLGGGVVLEAERQAARRKRPTDLTAYELYLRGLDELQPRYQGEHRGGDPPAHAGGREGPEPRPRLDGPGRGP